MNDVTEQKKAEPKPPVVAGAGMAAIVPTDLEQAFRLSQALSRGGDMVPKHFQGQPDQIMAAIMRGMEIGLAPMQALSNIAVINGRASLWGDALPALMQRAGHHIDVEIEGEGDNMVATASLIRGDTGRTITRTFTVADAKKAGLWGKAGPWQTYPKRMLSMRARALACRDGAADALMGLQVAEEMEDAPPMRDVTPKPGGFAARALGQKAPAEPASDAETATKAPDDIEIAQTAEGPSASDFEALAAEGFPGSDVFDKGREAFEAGKPITDCPYDIADPLGRQSASDWAAGYVGARRAKE